MKDGDVPPEVREDPMISHPPGLDSASATCCPDLDPARSSGPSLLPRPSVPPLRITSEKSLSTSSSLPPYPPWAKPRQTTMLLLGRLLASLRPALLEPLLPEPLLPEPPLEPGARCRQVLEPVPPEAPSGRPTLRRPHHQAPSSPFPGIRRHRFQHLASSEQHHQAAS